MNVPDIVYGHPVALAALTVALIVAVHYQRGLSYREARLAHLAKCYAFSILDRWATKRGRPLLREAHVTDYVRHVDEDPRAVVARLRPEFAPNLTSTAKYRVGPDGIRQFAHSQWATYYDRQGTRWQTEVYLFPREDGGTDVYAHVEAPVTDPERHTEGQQFNGDVHDRFAETYDA